MDALLSDAIRQVDLLLELCRSASATALQPSSCSTLIAANAKTEGGVKTNALTDAQADLFARALLQVGQVNSVEEFESEKLYKLQVLVGEGLSRQVIAGLKRHVNKKELEGSLVILILNLKPAKLAGQLSEAMVLAGVAPLPDGGELVRTCRPPDGSKAGDRVYLEGGRPARDPPKVLKSDLWKQIKSGLRSRRGEARFMDTRLVTDQGVVGLPPELPDGSEIC